MDYTNYRINLTEAGRSNPEQVKRQLCERLGGETFTHLSVEEHIRTEGDAQSRIVLEAGVKMSPVKKPDRITHSEFSKFATQIDDVTGVIRMAGA